MKPVWQLMWEITTLQLEQSIILSNHRLQITNCCLDVGMLTKDRAKGKHIPSLLIKPSTPIKKSRNTIFHCRIWRQASVDVDESCGVWGLHCLVNLQGIERRFQYLNSKTKGKADTN